MNRVPTVPSLFYPLKPMLTTFLTGGLGSVIFGLKRLRIQCNFKLKISNLFL